MRALAVDLDFVTQSIRKSWNGWNIQQRMTWMMWNLVNMDGYVPPMGQASKDFDDLEGPIQDALFVEFLDNAKRKEVDHDYTRAG